MPKMLACALIAVVLCGCIEKPFPTHEEITAAALAQVNYQDGVSKSEARAIGDAFLLQRGRYDGEYKDMMSWVRVYDAGDQWRGEVILTKFMTPVPTKIPPLFVDKKSGLVTWQGITVKEKIKMEQSEHKS